jgi:hypothetical protein
VASVYVVPPAVTLTVSPANNISSLCLGNTLHYCFWWGASFEFSVDGVVKQGMSTTISGKYTTDGQVVRVRTRYAVNFDGMLPKSSGNQVLKIIFFSITFF